MSKFLQLTILLSFLLTNTILANTLTTKQATEVIYKFYDEGNYQEAIRGLDKIQENVVQHSKDREDIQGLIYYWKGLCFNKLNEFESASRYLLKAINLKFPAPDIYYEYGQSLYALDQYKQARVAFKESINKKYKVAVSLYYIAFISQELNDYKKAVSFYTAIEKLPDEEKKEVMQAARMQIADIYLKQVEKMPDTFRSVEKYVIPQYQKALEWDPNSKLADEIRSKIKIIQKRYELILFKMRNGVQTAFPRHFIKFRGQYGVADNITNIDEISKASLDKEDYSSSYINSGFYGRYSFYPNSSYSISPEFTLNNLKYLSNSVILKPYNSRSYNAGLQINYEHLYKKNPATFYLNFNYSYNEDDADADDQIEKASTNSIFTLSEGLQFWTGQPTTLRYRYTQTTAVEKTSSFSTHSFIWEQLINGGTQSFFIYSAIDLNRYLEAKVLNSNAFTIRCDWILPTFSGLINPNIFASNRNTNFVKDEDSGVTNLFSYGLSLNRPVASKWYMTFDYVKESQSADQSSDNYEGTKMSLNFDYIY